MRTRLLAAWDALRTSYWFVPSLMMVAALTLGWATLQVDQRWPASTRQLCIDRLTASLSRLAGRRMPRPERSDANGRIRVIARPWTFPGAVEAAFDQIRQYSSQSTAVTIRLLESLAVLAGRLQRRADSAAVLRQAEMIERAYERCPQHDPLDRADVRERAARVHRALRA